MVITGRLVVLGVAGVLPVLVRPEASTVAWWFVVLMVLAGTDALLAGSPRQVRLVREVTPTVRLHESASSVLQVRSTGRRRLRGVVRDAWVPTAGAVHNRHPLRLRPGDGSRLVTPLLPARRGDLPAGDVTIRSLGPLGIAGRQASHDLAGTIRVLPEFASRRHLPSRLARLREMDGRAAVQIRGEGTEFDSLRDYVIGDDVRSIDWRATARRTEVVVRTWRPERDRRVLIVLDVGRTSAIRVGQGTRLDAGIEAALLLTALASHAGDRVELVAYDRAARARVTAVSGSRVLPTVAEALSGVSETLIETDWTSLVTWVRTHQSQRCLVVLLTGLEPSVVEEGLLPVIGELTSHHRVVLASARADSVADAAGMPAPDDAYDRASRERADLDRAAVAESLSRAGVRVIEGEGPDLAPQLCDAYLTLKSAGML